jgi:hypothetical protein
VYKRQGEDISALLTSGATAAAPVVETAAATETKSESPAAQPAAAALPEGVIVVTMPRLSDTMTEGTVATWLKKVGDTVAEVIFLLKSKQIKQLWSSNHSMLELYYISEFKKEALLQWIVF